MNLTLPGSLRSQFTERAEAAVIERVRHQRLDQERHRREQQERLEDSQKELLDFTVAMVSVAEADAFRLELDSYDTATVAALQQNEASLLASRKRLDQLFAKAHVLPDGRRVFKTEDGRRVFDEHGRELQAKDIEPDEIADHRPRWETAKARIDEYKALQRERSELLDYQEDLDAARERLDSGEMTRDEYDRLREGLKADMPHAVRELAGVAMDQPQSGKGTDDDLPLEIGDDMIPAAGARFAPGLTPG